MRDLPGIALYDMDDLQRAVARNLDERASEATEALVLVQEEVARFERWLGSLDVVPTISALRRRGDQVVEQVLRENETRWESLSEADHERLEVMARAVVSRLLHEPTLRLKDAAGDSSSYRHVHTRARCRYGGGSRARTKHHRRRLPPRRRRRHLAGSGWKQRQRSRLEQARLVPSVWETKSSRHDHDIRATARPRGTHAPPAREATRLAS